MDESREVGLAIPATNKSLQVSRDCVTFIKSLFSQVVATRAAT